MGDSVRHRQTRPAHRVATLRERGVSAFEPRTASTCPTPTSRLDRPAEAFERLGHLERLGLLERLGRLGHFGRLGRLGHFGRLSQLVLAVALPPLPVRLGASSGATRCRGASIEAGQRALN